MTYTSKKGILYEILAVTAGLTAAMTPPPLGLGQSAMWVIGMMLWAIINWITRVIPDFAVLILMCCGWVVLRIMPFDAAFVSFTGTTVWLLVGALGIGVAVTKSGLISRTALYIMKLCAPTYRGQVFAVLMAGLVLSPFIPSTTAKVAVAGALSTDVGEKLGLKDRSPAMTGIWLAMYTGFSLCSPIILSASYFAYMILTLMPIEVQKQFSFGYWLIAMLPWGVFVTLSCFAAIVLLYSPEEKINLKREDIDEMIKRLGPLSKNEKITLTVIFCCMICWIFEKRLGVPAAIPALFGMSLLLCLGVISKTDYNTKISWSLITFVGSAISLAAVITSVGLDTWIAATTAPLLGGIVSNLYLFLITVSAAIILTRFIIIDPMTCFTLYIVVLSPFCVDAGVSPWVLGICAYTVCQPWFVRYQNINFIIGFTSAGGDEKIDFKQTVVFCFVYNAVAIATLLLSIPYWRYLGLVK